MALRRLTVLAAGLWLLLAGAALAQKPSGTPAGAGPAQIVQSLPAELAGFRRHGDVFDYERRQGGAGFGASVEYRAPDAGGAAIATVYVYSANLTGLRDGAGGPEIHDQFAAMTREVEAVQAQRGNRLTTTTQIAPVPGRGGGAALACWQYHLVRAEGQPIDSYGCLGILGGRFVKIRLTFPGADPAHPRVLAGFGRAVVAALGG